MINKTGGLIIINTSEFHGFPMSLKLREESKHPERLKEHRDLCKPPFFLVISRHGRGL